MLLICNYAVVDNIIKIKNMELDDYLLAYICTRQAHIWPRRLFLGYSALIIDFKGVHMKLKIVAVAISKE